MADVTIHASDSIPPWRRLWQGPAVVVGMGSLIAALIFAAPPTSESDAFVELDLIAQQLEENQLNEAQTLLDATLSQVAQMPPQQAGRYWQYRGDLGVLQLRELAAGFAAFVPDPVVLHRIADAYERSSASGRPLDPMAQRRLALVHLQRRAWQPAVNALEQFEDPAQRLRLLRDMLETLLHTPDSGTEADADRDRLVLQLIDQFSQTIDQLPSPEQRPEPRLWLAAYEARLALARHDPQSVVDALLKQIPRLSVENQPAELAPLYLLLAEAGLQVGDLDLAQQSYEHVATLLPQDAPQQAAVLYGLAQIALQRSPTPEQLEEVLQQLNRVVEQFAGHSLWFDALLARADIHARLQTYPQAIYDYGQAIETLARVSQSPEHLQRMQRIEDSVLEHVRLLMEQEDPVTALELLNLLTTMYADQTLSPELTHLLATVHQQLAQQHLRQAQDLDSREAETDAQASQIDAARTLQHEKAAHYFERSATYFENHARAILLADPDAFAQSLLAAADGFEQAGQPQQAAGLLRELIQAQGDDALRLDATVKLATILRGMGEHEQAVALLQPIAEQQPRAPQTLLALVDLAQSLRRLGRTDEARQVLDSIIQGERGVTPQSPLYRDALVAMGQLHLQEAEQQPARYADAIEVLRAAEPLTEDVWAKAEVRYMLADALRRSCEVLRDAAVEVLAAGEQIRKAARIERLAEAQQHYEQVIAQLDAAPAQTLSESQRLQQRNAWFYRASCAEAADDSTKAVELYRQAARRWRDDPVAFVALVHIVNILGDAGQMEEARLANQRALDLLQQIPSQQLRDEMNLPLSRSQWRQWLRWQNKFASS